MSAADGGRLAALYRHPVKGFTPERLEAALLKPDKVFPCDRMYAVARGDIGFDPRAPRHVSKQRFTVLANHPVLARAVTRYDADKAMLHVACPGRAPISADLSSEAGRRRFAACLQDLLGEDEPQPLHVLAAPDGFRFTDHPQGFVSLLNLQSVRDLERRTNRAIDPLRFRANLWVEGWDAWAETALAADRELQIGEARLQVVKPIQRCIATHVDPATGVRDLDVLSALKTHYGHLDCGLYLRVLEGGRVSEGDGCPLPSPAEPKPWPTTTSPTLPKAPPPSPPSSRPGPRRATI